MTADILSVRMLAAILAGCLFGFVPPAAATGAESAPVLSDADPEPDGEVGRESASEEVTPPNARTPLVGSAAPVGLVVARGAVGTPPPPVPSPSLVILHCRFRC